MLSAWVLPRRGASVVYRLAPGDHRSGAALAEVCAVPMPPLAVHVLALDLGLLVYAQGRQLHVLRLRDGAAPAVERTLKLPWGLTIHALALREQVLYVGGSGRSELFGLVDLRAPTLRWAPQPVPPVASGFGKGIDGLALHGERLIAVDDIVIPRYFVVYDISDPRAPRLLGPEVFPWHLTAERVEAVASAGPWMAVLSGYANHGFFGAQVALVHLQTLRGHAALWVERPRSPRSGRAPVMDLRGVALHGSTLYLAAGAAGLATLDDITPFVARGPVPREVQVYPGGGAPPRSRTEEGFAEIPADALRLTPVPGGPVVAVVAAPGGAFAVVQGPAGPDAVWVGEGAAPLLR